jgi:hypothetical protein
MNRLVVRLAAGSLASVLLLGACGDDSASDPSSSDDSGSSDSTASASGAVETSAPAEPSPSASPIEPTETTQGLPDWPACEEVWVKDKTLPGRYKGCLQGTIAVKALQEYCEFGKKMVLYNDRFWAVRGGKVNDADGPLKDSEDFRADLASCQG